MINLLNTAPDWVMQEWSYLANINETVFLTKSAAAILLLQPIFFGN